MNIECRKCEKFSHYMKYCTDVDCEYNTQKITYENVFEKLKEAWETLETNSKNYAYLSYNEFEELYKIKYRKTNGEINENR